MFLINDLVNNKLHCAIYDIPAATYCIKLCDDHMEKLTEQFTENCNMTIE